MTLKPLKFMVQAVVLELDEAGAIIGERVSEPLAVYTAEQLAEFVETFEAQLAAAEPIEQAPPEQEPGHEPPRPEQDEPHPPHKGEPNGRTAGMVDRAGATPA